MYDDRGEPDVDLIVLIHSGLPYHERWVMILACAFQPASMKATHLIYTDGSCITTAQLFEILELPLYQIYPFVYNLYELLAFWTSCLFNIGFNFDFCNS